MDGIIICAVVNELKKSLLGFNLNKIYQPEQNEIILAANKNKLLICADPSCPRLNLTSENKINPQTAPMFCMILRKYIQNGRIINISQPDFERIVNFEIESVNEFGDTFFYKLIVEIMGKHSNIILVNAQNRIIDSIKHVPAAKSSVRQILPGLEYKMPPSSKFNPLEITADEFIKLPDLPLYQLLNGISPAVSEEITIRANGNKTTFCNAFFEIHRQIINNDFDIQIIFDENDKPIALSAIYLKKYAGYKKIKYESMSQAIEKFYFGKAKTNSLRQKSSDLQKIISNNISRCVKKKDLQLKTFESVKNKDRLKLFGELVMANIYQIPNGSEYFCAQNYYDASIVKIELDKNLTAVENAQAYFKKYDKQKRTQTAVIEQINKNNLELEYLEGVMQNLNLCQNENDIEEIRQELYQQKIIRKKNRVVQKKSLPLHFISSDGFNIYVGKNNLQNDFLTLKFANGNDFWLHTKNIPGSHVIIKCEKKAVSTKTLAEAANICAFYSKACSSSNVAVDYTQKKFVKKPSGAKPGMVVYENYKTIYVTPDKNLVEKLKSED